MGETERLQQKKEQVLGLKPGFRSTGAIIVLAMVAIVGGVLMLKSSIGSGSGAAEVGARAQVSRPLDYSLRRYDMKPVKAVQNGKNVIVSLADIVKYRMISFTVKGGVGAPGREDPGDGIPLLAYITPAGNLNTVISYCGPCRGTELHTEIDATLTCNVCGTKWTLEDETPVSGACTEYPPAPVKAKVRGGKVYLDKQEIVTWKPRVEG